MNAAYASKQGVGAARVALKGKIGAAIRRFIVFCCVVLWTCAPASGEAQTVPEPLRLAEDNPILLELRVDQTVLTDSLTGLLIGQLVYLPLAETARLLTVAIRVGKEGHDATGFVRREDQRFHLDASLATVTIGDITSRVDPKAYRVLPDDIYVESTLLGAWLRVDLPVNQSILSIQARPLEPLPLQQRLLREKMLYGNPMADQPVVDYPFRDSPYAMLGLPVADQTLTFGTTHGQGVSTVHASSSTFLKGDLAGLQSAVFLSRSNDQMDSVSRMTLGRADPNGALLGPLRATAFSVGSVSVPGLANRIATSDTGNGFSLTNTPLNRPSKFSSNTLQGDLPPGWDVELFYNDALVSYQQSRADGKYVFLDLPVFYGRNEFRLVFHGPQGQLRVERRSYLLDETMVEPGRFFYDMAMHKTLSGLRQSTFLGEWGIGPKMSMSVAMLERQNFGAPAARYYNTSLRSIIREAVIGLSLTRQAGGGQVTDFSVKTQLNQIVVNFNHAQSDRFQSPQSDGLTLLTRTRDLLQLSGALPTGFLTSASFMLGLSHDQKIDGTTRSDMTSMFSTSLQVASLSNFLHWKRDSLDKTVDGSLQVGANVGIFRMRGQMNYLLRPERKIDTIAFSADVLLKGDYLANMTYSRSVGFARDGITASLNKSFEKFAIGVSSSVFRGGESSVMFQIFTSIGHDPRTSKITFDSMAGADSGAMSARVFLDKNGNGIMDPGEPLMPNIGFVVNQSQLPVRTDESGIAYIKRLPPNRQTNVGINLATIEDPTLSAHKFGVRFIPRPGDVMQVDFPIVALGEVDGTVSVDTNRRRRGVGDVLMEVVKITDTAIEVVSSARSSGDGFFVVQELPEGTYNLRPSPKQISEMGLQQPANRILTIRANKMFISGQDFLLLDK